MKRGIGLLLIGFFVLSWLPGCAAGASAATTKPKSAEETRALEKDRGGALDDAATKTESAKADTRERTATVDVSAKRTQQSGLTAGINDDNKQFNRFAAYLEKYAGAVDSLPLPVQERIILRISDQEGRSLANARVSVGAGGRRLADGLTYADGTFLFFPSEHAGSFTRYEATVEYAGAKKAVNLVRGGPREIAVALDLKRPQLQNVPLDILFIFDTTASMAEEINRLKTTIEIIYSNISVFSSKPKVRFGLVLYRDREDDYVTQVVPLTDDLSRFQASLEKVEASGGGDWPEDLQQALSDSMWKIEWNKDGIRLGFIITDAPPHLDYGQNYTYVSAVREAREKGIKLYSIGTGELPLAGEYILRQISQYTYAKFIFLTYGERTDTEGGKLASVSHHVGENYQTDKLEALVMQLAREELSHLTSQPIKPEEEFFQASRIDEEKKAETLKKLFDLSFSQLADYSSLKLAPGTRVSVLPYVAAETDLAKQGEYFTEQSLLSMAANRFYKLVERQNLQQVLAEMKLQLSDLADETKAARVGKIVGAEVLVMGKVYRVKDNYEIFVKLVRVETAEILSVIKVKIDKALGL